MLSTLELEAPPATRTVPGRSWHCPDGFEHSYDRTLPGARILILSASVGCGHTRAARAIHAVLSRRLPDAFIEHIDVLEMTNSVFRRAYGAGYFRAVRRAPRLIGWMYDFLDHPGTPGMTGKARLAFERLNFRRLSRLLVEQHWDLVINTHFLPAAIVARLLRVKAIDYPQVAVVTDFDAHGLWIQSPCEKFFLATDEARANVIACGVAAARTVVTGIPIDPRFSEPKDRAAIMQKLGLDPAKRVVLQMAGGFGIGSIERIHHSIGAVEQPLQVIVVMGQNREGKVVVEGLPFPSRHQRTVLGYTTQMHEYMAVADLVVSKPGGLTTSECLASGCPLVVVEPIPGQEDRNADFVLENGCGIKVNNLASLTLKLSELLADAPRLATMRGAALRCAKPRAVFDVVDGCLGVLEPSLRQARITASPSLTV
jgi:processive 1,2-diacylglycerol beta-glucosyltransferase